VYWPMGGLSGRGGGDFRLLVVFGLLGGLYTPPPQ
jgi:hypothetical protein